MSIDAESSKKRSTILSRAHGLLEIPALFELNQIIVDGGKRAPIERFLGGIDYETVLDLGCGTGVWSYLAPGRYLGIDYSESFIAGCRRRFRNDPRKKFAVGDLESLNVQESFDLAMMLSVLHHLSDVQALALLQQLAGRTRRILVMDLMPIQHNPLSRLLYDLDRGDHIRSADMQRSILTQTRQWDVEREDSFYSYNRLYRHTLFLLKAPSTPGQVDSQQH